MTLNSLFCADVPLSNYSLTSVPLSGICHNCKSLGILTQNQQTLTLWLLREADISGVVHVHACNVISED